MAPSLSGSTRVTGHPDYVIKPLLHGMSGPIDGRTYPQVMAPLGSNRDQWIADIASFVRNSFGNVCDVGYRQPTSPGFEPRRAVERASGRSPNWNCRCPGY